VEDSGDASSNIADYTPPFRDVVLPLPFCSYVAHIQVGHLYYTDH